MKRKRGKKIWPSLTGIWTPDLSTNSRPKFEIWERLDLSSPGFLELLDFTLTAVYQGTSLLWNFKIVFDLSIINRISLLNWRCKVGEDRIWNESLTVNTKKNIKLQTLKGNGNDRDHLLMAVFSSTYFSEKKFQNRMRNKLLLLLFS